MGQMGRKKKTLVEARGSFFLMKEPEGFLQSNMFISQSLECYLVSTMWGPQDMLVGLDSPQ